ncbi:hypothetical protein Desaci_1399 [Desulfosporosinus acidiphilus SJ4]|uniref:Uncharacterized protein n=1 Tax=Desulfosporosinus acidiphilus (strain DSM 22704 / JCM 16185 / SJ4) TaxID=646529 RepID=I4D3P8_DESAJ|nr:hypothetical protein [Desulfosporosinus acidiphilus]AFM40422.1 hypothetical protein Desaci_1399 [Desulfosporosinus acidiphilus SJ4]
MRYENLPEFIRYHVEKSELPPEIPDVVSYDKDLREWHNSKVSMKCHSLTLYYPFNGGYIAELLIWEFPLGDGENLKDTTRCEIKSIISSKRIAELFNLSSRFSDDVLKNREYRPKLYFTDPQHEELFKKYREKFPDRWDYHALIYILTSSQGMREVILIDDEGPDWEVMDQRAQSLGSQHQKLYEFSKNIIGRSDSFDFGKAVFIWPQDIWPIVNEAIQICRGKGKTYGK